MRLNFANCPSSLLLRCKGTHVPLLARLSTFRMGNLRDKVKCPRLQMHAYRFAMTGHNHYTTSQ